MNSFKIPIGNIAHPVAYTIFLESWFTFLFPRWLFLCLISWLRTKHSPAAYLSNLNMSFLNWQWNSIPLVTKWIAMMYQAASLRITADISYPFFQIIISQNSFVYSRAWTAYFCEALKETIKPCCFLQTPCHALCQFPSQYPSSTVHVLCLLE